jgi:hypothetical protein
MISKAQLEETNKGHEEVAATSKVEKKRFIVQGWMTQNLLRQMM